jgi:hypothetical protein
MVKATAHLLRNSAARWEAVEEAAVAISSARNQRSVPNPSGPHRHGRKTISARDRSQTAWRATTSRFDRLIVQSLRIDVQVLTAL